MAEGTLRGSRLGATSYETDVHVDFAARTLVTFVCTHGHSVTVPFSVEAEEIPAVWECRCGASALRRDSAAPAAKPVRVGRTHWDMLLERRSIEDLEELLTERLEVLHSGRVPSADLKSA